MSAVVPVVEDVPSRPSSGSAQPQRGSLRPGKVSWLDDAQRQARARASVEPRLLYCLQVKFHRLYSSIAKKSERRKSSGPDQFFRTGTCTLCLMTSKKTAMPGCFCGHLAPKFKIADGGQLEGSGNRAPRGLTAGRWDSGVHSLRPGTRTTGSIGVLRLGFGAGGLSVPISAATWTGLLSKRQQTRKCWL